MKDRSISVVCPTYNSAEFILNTLRSVISQSSLPYELIIIDDGSTDNTISLIELFIKENRSILPIKLFSQNHKGPGAARNFGINEASSGWIAFLDSDDLWFPNKIERVVSEMNCHPNANFFSHNEIMKDLDGSDQEMNYIKHLNLNKPLVEQLYFRNFFSTSTVICKRDLLIKWNGFNVTLSSAQDYELWLRISVDMIPVYLKDCLGKYIMREGNISTSNYWRRLQNMLRIKIIHRRKVSLHMAAFSIGMTIAYHLLFPFIRWIKSKY
jgi:glycosyltransferase involved in cell wall biosynthesis